MKGGSKGCGTGDVSGGFGMFKKSEMERLFRDARCGRFHPANSSLTHELLGKLGDLAGTLLQHPARLSVGGGAQMRRVLG